MAIDTAGNENAKFVKYEEPVKHDFNGTGEIANNAKKKKLESSDREESYWDELLENQSIKTVAARLLKRLQYTPHGLLLDLYPQHIRPLVDYFRASARQQLSLLDLDKQERINAKNHPVLMPELSFEGQGKNEEAAALYALEHDLSVNNGNAYTEFVHWILRYKLANVLDTIDEQEVLSKKHITLVEEVAAVLKETNTVEDVPQESLSALKFQFFEWLGILYDREENYSQASDAFLIASDNAPDFDLEMANTSRAAGALFNGGDEQAAFRLMESVKQDIDEISDKEIREQWEVIYGWMRYQMGAQGHGAPGVLQSEPARLIVDTMESWLRNEAPPDEAKLDEFIAWLNSARSQLSDSDARGQFNLILGLLRTVSALDHPQQWQALMDEAEAIEQQIEDIKPRLQRQLLLARQKTFVDPDQAIDLFKMIWLEIQRHFKTEEQLSATGFYLDALIRRLNDDVLEIAKSLVNNTLALYLQLIKAQPGGAARRRIRETHQRSIESALAALLTMADHQGQESETGQQALSSAWRLLMATRNPELMGS